MTNMCFVLAKLTLIPKRLTRKSKSSRLSREELIIPDRG